MILAEMCSVNAGRTDEEKHLYHEGLKQVLQNLRNKKTKDFATVAAEISAYRGTFLKDSSRVLVLDP